MSRHGRPLRFDRPKVLGVAAVRAAAPGALLLLGAGGTPRPPLAAAYAHNSTDNLPENRLLEVQSSTKTDTSVVATVDYDSGLQLVIELVTDRSGSWRVVTVLTAPAGC